MYLVLASSVKNYADTIGKPATAVEWMWSVAGTSGIFQASPFERYFRDMQVLKQHAFYSEQRYETVGRVYVGLPPQFATLER